MVGVPSRSWASLPRGRGGRCGRAGAETGVKRHVEALKQLVLTSQNVGLGPPKCCIARGHGQTRSLRVLDMSRYLLSQLGSAKRRAGGGVGRGVQARRFRPRTRLRRHTARCARLTTPDAARSAVILVVRVVEASGWPPAGWEAHRRVARSQRWPHAPRRHENNRGMARRAARHRPRLSFFRA